MENTLPLILAVDDDRAILTIVETMLNHNGYEVITAISYETAKQAIIKNHLRLDAILLDRILPDKDGIEIARWLNNNSQLSKPPIVMLTVLDKAEQIKEGIEEGIFYYLTKPIQETIFNSVISSAVKESKQHKILTQEINKHRNSFKLVDNALLKIKTLSEAEDAACFLANFFPNSSKALPGIAALIVNAVEHGNCQISYDEKSKLIAEGNWRQEVERRLTLEENKNKYINVLFFKRDKKYVIQISDQGSGFAWQKFINVNPSRALDNHGRGIARANMIFDSIEYNKQGNQVIAIINQTDKETFTW